MNSLIETAYLNSAGLYLLYHSAPPFSPPKCRHSDSLYESGMTIAKTDGISADDILNTAEVLRSMGRFLNSKTFGAGSAPAPPLVPQTAMATAPAAAVAIPQSLPQPRPAPSKVIVAGPSIGILALGVYIISGGANEISLKLFGVKPYVSWISGILLVISYLLGGAALRGVRTIEGRLWIALSFLMILAGALGIWRGSSFEMLRPYLSRAMMMCFYTVSLALTLKQCRSVGNYYIYAGIAILISCVAFGAAIEDNGRFRIPDSSFFENPNDLAMALLFNLPFFYLLTLENNQFKSLVGFGLCAIDGYYLFKTGSRGCFVGAVVLMALLLCFSRSRGKLFLLLTVMGICSVALMPKSTWHRLFFIVLNKAEVSRTGIQQGDTSDYASQIERQALVKQSITIALHHPLLGIGPGNFADQIYRDDMKTGKRHPNLGTHNTYTQIAAECGLPAFFIYVAIIVLTVRSSYQLFKTCRGKPAMQPIGDLAFALFTCTVAFAVASTFHHLAYNTAIPGLSGLAIALRMASEPYIDMSTAA